MKRIKIKFNYYTLYCSRFKPPYEKSNPREKYCCSTLCFGSNCFLFCRKRYAEIKPVVQWRHSLFCLCKKRKKLSFFRTTESSFFQQNYKELISDYHKVSMQIRQYQWHLHQKDCSIERLCIDNSPLAVHHH